MFLNQGRRGSDHSGYSEHGYVYDRSVQSVPENLTENRFINALDVGKVLWNGRYVNWDDNRAFKKLRLFNCEFMKFWRKKIFLWFSSNWRIRDDLYVTKSSFGNIVIFCTLKFPFLTIFLLFPTVICSTCMYSVHWLTADNYETGCTKQI